MLTQGAPERDRPLAQPQNFCFQYYPTRRGTVKAKPTKNKLFFLIFQYLGDIIVTRRRFLAGCSAVPFLSYLSLNSAFAATPPSMLVMAMQLDNMTSLDPAESFEAIGSEFCGNLYQRLVMPDPEKPSDIKGELASSWERSADGKTFTFHMNPSVKFSDGSPLTAEDAAFSLQRVVKLDKGPAFIINQFGFTKENVEQMIVAKDAQTLVLNLSEPAAETFLLYCLSAPVGSVVQKKTALANQAGDDQGNAWIKQHSAGSGPFTLRAWKASESVILEKNDQHPSKSPVKRVIAKHIIDPSAQLLMLQKGDGGVAGRVSARARPQSDAGFICCRRGWRLAGGQRQQHQLAGRG